MKTSRLVPSGLVPLALAVLMSLALPGPLRSQDDHKGKIDDVEHSADNARRGHDHDHDDDDSGGGFFFFLLRGLLHSSRHTASPDSAPLPEPPGQGYLPYPYAERQAPTSFVMRNVTTGRGFASFSASWFRDDESTLRSAQFAFEAAHDQALFTAEYSFYREPMPDATDYLHLGHVALSGLGPIGDIGYFKVGLALQGVLTDQPRTAGGPGLDVGFELLPGRPLGFGGGARVAALTWKDGPLFGTGFVDLMGHGSVFIGRVELLGGYRWTRIGVGSPFHGPTLGMRVWF